MHNLNENIKVSVIIPIYNVKEYIDECMKSLINQTFRDFEIICVDDCSDDGTYEKILAYSRKYKNIRLYRNSENLGAALCRNKGLEYAEGKYVIFVDSDDVCHEQYLEQLFLGCEHSKADAAFCNYNLYENRDISLKWIINSKNEEIRFDLIKKPLAEPWNKMVLRSFLLKNGIKFQDIPNTNDMLFSLMVIVLADKVHIVERDLYTYRKKRGNNLSSQREKRTFAVFVFEAFIIELRQRELWSGGLREAVLGMIIRILYGLVIQPNFREIVKADFYEKIFPLLSSIDEAYIFSNEWLSYQYNYLIGKEDILQSKYQFYHTKIVRWLKQYEDKNVVLWGAGKLGQLFIDALESERNRIVCIIDNDKNKQGTELSGVSIYSYEEKKNDIDVVLVLSPFFLDGIKEQIVEATLVVDMDNVIDSFERTDR